MLSNALALLTRLRSNRRGNVLMIFAFAVIPMVFATGMGIDYARAARLRTKLDAVADSAALAAVTQPMMNVADLDQVKTRAEDMFKAQAEGLEGLDDTPVLDIEICQPPQKACNEADIDPAHPNARIAKVSYTAGSLNAFGGVLNMRTIKIGGSSRATAVGAPNMDFYLALDTSPSMALPTTQAGIDQLDAPLACSFACHTNKIENNYPNSVKGLIRDITKYSINKPNISQAFINVTVQGVTKNLEIQRIDSQNTYVFKTASVNDTIPSTLKTQSGAYVRDLCKISSTDSRNVCVYNADGSFVDSYWYALNQNVRLRVTDERSAVKDLMALAQSYAELNKRIYRASLYTFDHSTKTTQQKIIVPMPADMSKSNLSDVSTAADKVELVTVNDKQANGCPPTSCASNRYLFTSFKTLLDDMGGVSGKLGLLPANSGQGSNEPNDTPQGYLFIVTDGISDEQSSLLGPSSLVPRSLGEDRTRSEIVQAHIDQCNQIKGRGFKIAILYTEYTKESIKDDEQNQRDFVTANLPDVAPALSACASPGLMYTVKTDESISKALQELFTKALATARIIN